MKRTSNLNSFFQKIDAFGATFELNFDNQLKFKSPFGGILTILMVCVLILAFFFLISDMILKNNPFYSSRILSNALRPNLTLSINNGFLIEDEYGNAIRNYLRIFSIKLIYYDLHYEWDKDGFAHSNYTTQNLSLFDCTEEDFSPENKKSYDDNNLRFGVCFNDTQKIGGYFDSPYAKFVVIGVSRCVNSSENNYSCLPQEEINELMFSSKQFQISMYYEDLSYDAKNYSSPLSPFMRVKSYFIDPDFTKVQNIFFQEYKVFTDNGIIGNEYSNVTRKRIESTETRFYSGNMNSSLIYIRIFTSDITQTYTRSYMKLQDALGQLGVVFNLIFSFFSLITQSIYQSTMRETLMKKVFEIRIDDLEPKKEEESLDNKSVKIELNSPQKNISELENNYQPRGINQLEGSSVNEQLSLYEKFNKRKLKSNENQFSISINEHFISKYFPCFKNDYLIQKEKVFDSIDNIITGYTDILSIIINTTEVEKLKYILLSEHQLALFNFISLPEIPLKKNMKKKVSNLYKYSKNYKDQEQQIIKYIEKLKSKEKKISRLEKRLIDIID